MIALLSIAILAAAPLPDGFQGVKFGASPKEVRQSSGAIVNDVTDGSSLFRSVEVGGERGFAYYVFLGGRLSYVEIMLAGADRDGIRTLLEEKYGSPTEIPESVDSREAIEWRSDASIIRLTNDVLLTLTYADAKTYEEARAARAAAIRRKADEEKAKKLKSL